MNQIDLLRCVALAGLLAFGCGAEAEHRDTDDIGAISEEVVFSVDYSATGKLWISQNAQGLLSAHVDGAIGIDDELRAGAAIAKATLAETYLALLPEATDVPLELALLSETYRTQQDEAAPDKTMGRHVGDEAQQTFVKSFSSEACQTFKSGRDTYTPAECRSTNCGSSTPCGVQTSNGLLDSRDRSYAWNQTAAPAYHFRIGGGGGVWVAAYTWQWTNWSGSFSGKNVGLSHGSSIGSGVFGVTVHNWSTIIH
jgi:hypothetical protein